MIKELLELLTFPLQQKIIDSVAFNEYKCPNCGAEFRVPKTLKEASEDIEAHIESKDIPQKEYICPHCGTVIK